MTDIKVVNYIKHIIPNLPEDWLKLTTHRLDIYDEALAKTQFLEQFENLFDQNNDTTIALSQLPTAYDYIRLGHPLSCVLEWAVAKIHDLHPENVVSFSSQTIPILAILRTNLLENKSTQIVYTDALPEYFESDILKTVYGYQFELKKIDNLKNLSDANGQEFDSTILLSTGEGIQHDLVSYIDFLIINQADLGSILIINGDKNSNYISDVQHVRRRETIAMTPENTLAVLKTMVGIPIKKDNDDHSTFAMNKSSVLASIHDITGSDTKALVASSGLSMQYAIMMGLVDHAIENHPGKNIKFIVPPNCYGGTNDQARRVAACIENVDVVDLLVDGENDMVRSIDNVLTDIAKENAVPYIIAEIPTNPRVEVPNLKKLQDVLIRTRETSDGAPAIDPVFILDQTFCPNVHFLGDGDILSEVRTISYVSGSKFPSGGKCTAGYCVGNTKTADLLDKVELHLHICDNEATPLQYEILAQQMPSMNHRIKKAYKNTREFVNFIHETLPSAKINFVSEDFSDEGFTPSVFSLDLPTKGRTDEAREAYKRALNLKLINLMISEIPDESKFCVSYGQLKGSYWTIPATSTQGTTKEGDKDYIVRVSIAPDLDMALHKKIFSEFADTI